MKCAVQIYMVLGGFHVYKSVFLGWVVGRFNIAVNGEHNCVLPAALTSTSSHTIDARIITPKCMMLLCIQMLQRILNISPFSRFEMIQIIVILSQNAIFM